MNFLKKAIFIQQNTWRKRKLPDAFDKEHYQSVIRTENTKSVKQ